jgi:hypothetical protein
MPYIPQTDRPPLRDLVMMIKDEIMQKYAFLDWAGRVNYVISLLVVELWGLSGKHARYTNLNTAMGVLHSAAAEIYRRWGAKIEDRAMATNGDI